MMVFENWLLRRIFGPKGDGVTGEWRKLHKEELYLSGDQTKKNEICWVCSTYRGQTKCVQGVGGET